MYSRCTAATSIYGTNITPVGAALVSLSAQFFYSIGGEDGSFVADMTLNVGGDWISGANVFADIADRQNSSVVCDISVSVEGNLDADDFFTYVALYDDSSVKSDITIDVGGDLISDKVREEPCCCCPISSRRVH